MRLTEIIWLEYVIEKLDIKHHVQPYEVKEVLDARPYFRFIEKGHRSGENVYAAFGQTEAGRYLSVFFVHKLDSQALILTARDMTHAERVRYNQR